MNAGRTLNTGDDELMTLSQAANFLRVNATELMAAARAGELPFHQRPSRLLFSRAELFQAMQNAHSRESDEPPEEEVQ